MATEYGDPVYVEALPPAPVVVARPEPITVSPGDASEMLGVHRSTVYDMAKRGDIRMLKMGNRTLIPYADLIAYMERLPLLYGPQT